MFGKNIVRKSVTLVTVVAVWTVYSMVAFALPRDVAGEITVTGQVTVNGQPAVSNQSILSGAVISTAAGSSAVVSLGKLGRVEIQPESSMTLSFSETGIITMIDTGRVRISSSSGIAATATTKNATIVADMAQENNFLVEVECSHTHVDATTGSLTIREGSSARQVAAGTSATAGDLSQPGCRPCLRPDSAPGPATAGSLWLLLLAAGIAGIGIFFAIDDDDTIGSGVVPVISPTR